MRNIDKRFLEEYIKTDELIQKKMGLEKGLSQYVDLMKENYDDGRKTLSFWQQNYSDSKNLRYKRNKLAHESGYEEVKREDIKKLREIRKNVKKGNDALQLYLTAEKRSHRPYRKENRGKSLAVISVILTVILIFAVMIFILTKTSR